MSTESKKLDSPFYDDHESLAIYADKIVLHNDNERTILFDDVNYIIFRKMNFSLYRRKQKFYYITLFMHDNDVINVSASMTGYIALKKFYEKGIQTTGFSEEVVVQSIAILALAIFLGSIYYFVLR